MQLDGKKILVDPVLSGNASPIPGTVKAFKGTDRYSVDDLPEIDYLLISHDHYDHLDYKTIKALKDKVKNVYCGLGVGAHFEKWGFDLEQIHEQDWHDTAEPDSGFFIHTMPARHFSGRGFSRKNTLWASYVIQSSSKTVYVGGDSGYDDFFAEIGQKFESIDLAILDNGQYNDAWKEIHLHPEYVLKAAQDLNAKQLFPVHSSKFVLAMHPWDEPLKELRRLNQESLNPIPLFTPIIGEKVNLDDSTRVFEDWWEGVD
jgi:L-ascorbate metabolism protein UlaG (beta-lactamase superfamily)